MKITNLSAEPLGRLHSWIPHDLEAELIVFLPDACPGKSPLPTGTAVLTKQQDWRKFALSDCGCGMRLLRSNIAASELDAKRWNRGRPASSQQRHPRGGWLHRPLGIKTGTQSLRFNDPPFRRIP